MRNQNEHIIKFEASGKILFSTAPFIEVNKLNISEYFTIFEDLDKLSLGPDNLIQAYECKINNETFYFDLLVEIEFNQDLEIYTVTIYDKTESYRKLRDERTVKNKNEIENDLLKIQIEKLNKKLDSIEEFMYKSFLYDLSNSLKDIYSTINYLNQKKESLSSNGNINKLIELSNGEAVKIIKIIDETKEYFDIFNKNNFEKFHYCSLLDLVNDSIDRFQNSHNAIIDNNLVTDLSVFVNNDHIITIILKSFNYLLNFSNKNEKFEISFRLSEQSESLTLIFKYGPIDMSPRIDNLVHDYNNNMDSIQTALIRKLVRMYNGSTWLSIKANHVILNLEFRNLLLQKPDMLSA